MNVLERSSATLPTEARYMELVKDFLVREANIERDVDAVVDAALATHFQDLFDKGEPANKGEQTLAGLEFLAPQFSKFGSRRLPRCKRALKGWRRRRPARSRKPHALAVWSGIIWLLAGAGQWSMAVYLLWMLVTYNRPGEPLNLCREDLLRPRANINKNWLCILFRQERGKT